MKIKKLLIKNYRVFKDVQVTLNNDCNIFVGDNDSGKSTLLEILQVLLSGKVNNQPFERQIKASYFNIEKRTEFIESITKKSGLITELPKIIVEGYFEDDGCHSEYKGTNNELGENCPGIRMTVEFNEDYSNEYKILLQNNEIYDIPVEFYKVSWRDFGDNPIVFRSFPLKVSLIDTTQKDYSSALNRFINSRITNNLSEEERTQLATAYRRMKYEFNNNPSVVALNKRIKAEGKLDDKEIKFGLREETVESWMDEVSIEIGNIPFEDMGIGTQNLIKMELVYKQDTDKSNVILFEEPENNLAFGNMSRLISKIKQDKNKQVFISTHSSFVANKLGLKNIILVNKGGYVRQLNEIDSDTMNFFKKLPGYETVRFLLANRVILVEGPTDELIVQRAYLDRYGKLPIEDGVDIITVHSLAFKRYCDLAVLVRKPLRIVTDNDGNVEKNIKEKYKEYLDNHSDLIEIFYETNESLNTLELSVLEVNSGDKGNYERFLRVIFKGSSVSTRDKEEVKSYMLRNKTEWGLRVFDSEECIQYPKYIQDAIQ
jgi:predicted ATP-dependent endonuclease of OLD family